MVSGDYIDLIEKTSWIADKLYFCLSVALEEGDADRALKNIGKVLGGIAVKGKNGIFLQRSCLTKMLYVFPFPAGI